MRLGNQWNWVCIYMSGLAVAMIVVGAVMWSNAAYGEHVGCDLQRKIDAALPVFTAPEVAARYQACLATASSTRRWAMPVTITGAILALPFLALYAFIFIPEVIARVRENVKR